MELYLLLILALLLFYYLFRSKDKRLSSGKKTGLVTEYGIHFTLNSVYNQQDIFYAVRAFDKEWSDAYPQYRKKFIKQLKRTNITWVGKRIRVPSGTVLAKMEKVGEIEIWIGPKLINGNRDISYTGLFDQLAKLAMLANNIDPNTDDPVIKGIIRRARNRLDGDRG